MSDLQRLQKRMQGHLADAEEWLHEAPPEYADDAKKEFEDWQLSVLILSLLDRVREECEVDDVVPWEGGQSLLDITGPADLLRQLAERLKQD